VAELPSRKLGHDPLYKFQNDKNNIYFLSKIYLRYIIGPL
jgi:hypothetical protein